MKATALVKHENLTLAVEEGTERKKMNQEKGTKKNNNTIEITILMKSNDLKISETGNFQNSHSM